MNGCVPVYSELRERWRWRRRRRPTTVDPLDENRDAREFFNAAEDDDDDNDDDGILLNMGKCNPRR